RVGYIYAEGDGVRQDYHKAFEYAKKGCSGKDAVSCLNLGTSYYNGQGVRQDKSQAKEYYGKACDLGEQNGCKEYAKLNERGIQ
ncbi:MAG: sel1 repeat family protein, partial [Campylobacteraceae bacterium]|nr:sel1 repeat family protein [Campylobacteraceae bacterium]